MAPPLPLLQTLEELAAKQQEDQDAMIATLNSLSEENQTARDERVEDRATLKKIAETLQKLQGSSPIRRINNTRKICPSSDLKGGARLNLVDSGSCRHPRLHHKPGTGPRCRILLSVRRDSTKLTFPSLTGQATQSRG
jgi:hypothetical protein